MGIALIQSLLPTYAALTISYHFYAYTTVMLSPFNSMRPKYNGYKFPIIDNIILIC